MAGVKISGLPAIPSACSFTDIYPEVQVGVTYRATLLQLATLYGFDATTHLLALSKGGTNANLTAANGAIPYSSATAIALLAPGTLGQLFRSGGAGAPTWTTATFPATSGTSGNVLVSDGTNWSSSATTGITALGAQAQALNMNTHLINNVVDPVSAQDAATKNYVDQTALNGTTVYAASTTNLTVTQSGAGVGATLTNAGAQATFSLDSVSPPVGSNVLIKDLAAPQNEGIYTVTSVGSGSTNWVLTRASSYDTPIEINNTGLIVIQNGSTLAGTAWYNAATIVTVDTTAFSYAEFGNIVFPISLAHGGTNAALTASNGGIFYSTATTGAILAATATANQMLQSGASGAPHWSTSTYPTTNAVNTLLYASSANVMAALATANSSVLVTGAGGIPAWSNTPFLGAATATSINFGGTSLANYVQGSWTPVDASGAGLAFSAAGSYTRIGNIVTAWCNVTYPVTADVSAAVIGGLPLSGGDNTHNNGQVVYSSVTTLRYVLMNGGGAAGTTFNLYTNSGAVITNAVMSNATNFFSFTYGI